MRRNIINKITEINSNSSSDILSKQKKIVVPNSSSDILSKQNETENDKNIEDLYIKLNGMCKKKSKHNVRFKEETQFISSIEYKDFINNFNKIELLEFTDSDLTIIKSCDLYKTNLPNIDQYSKILTHLVHNNIDLFCKPQIKLKIIMPVIFKNKWIELSPNIKRCYSIISNNHIPYIYIPDLLQKSLKYNFNGSLNESIGNNDLCIKLIKKHYNDSIILYNILIKNNVNIDTAISILPQSTYIIFTETGSLYDYFLLYKNHNNDLKQHEMHTFVSTINCILQNIYPESWTALINSLRD